MRSTVDPRRAPRARAVAVHRAATLAQMTSTSVLIVLALVIVLLFGTLAVTVRGDRFAAAGTGGPTVSQVTWTGNASRE